MKLLVILFLSTLLINVSHAQQLNSANANGLTTHKSRGTGSHLVENILQKQYVKSQYKHLQARKTSSGGTYERLKAYSGYNYTDTSSFSPAGKSDSGYFYYTGTNGSVFNYQAAAYALIKYSYATLASVNLNSPADYYLYQPVFRCQGAEVMSDSEAIWTGFCSDTGGFLYGLFGKTSYSYSGNNITSLLHAVFHPVSTEQLLSQMKYDMAGSLTESLFLGYNAATTAWDTVSLKLYYYDTFGNLVIDSSSTNAGGTTWYPEEKNIYSYDAFNNLVYSEVFLDSDITSGIWQPYQKYFFTYNADNTVHTDSSSIYSSGTWYPVVTDSFGYTTGISYYTYHQYVQHASETSFFKSIDIKHVSAAGRPDTVFLWNYSNYPAGGTMKMQAGKKFPFAYDSYNNPVSGSVYNYVITDSITGAGHYDATLERIFYYYYETYVTPLSAPNVKATHETIEIYPNPAGDRITISRPDAIRGSYTLIHLTNQLGQTVRTESLQWMTGSETFSLGGLASGIYMLNIQDENGSILASEKVVKQ